MYLSFLRQTTCLRILSLCLSRDVHFSHGFRLWKNRFLQLFRPFALPARTPIIFPFQGRSTQQEFSIKSPAFPPFIFSFRGHPSQPHFPINDPLVSPDISPFRRNLQGDFRAKHCLFAKIQYFLVQISACPAWDWGDSRGGWMGRNLGNFPPKHPSEREKIGECLGAVWGRNGVKTGRFKH